MRVFGPINSGSATGGAGTATANTSTATRVIGRVIGVYVKYNDSPPATTDVIVKTVGTAPASPTYNLLSLSNANTSGWFYPQVQIHDTSGSAIAGEYEPQLVYDQINVSIAQANDNDSIDVWLLLAEI